MQTPDYFSAGIWLLIFGSTSLIFIVTWYLGIKRRRQLEGRAVSKLRSAAQGAVAIDGRVDNLPGSSIRTPFSGNPCVWWEYTISETTRDSNRNTRERIVATDQSRELFLLYDDTGECVVDPSDAEVWFAETRQWQDSHVREPGDHSSSSNTSGRYTYKETFILPGALVFAMGDLQTLRPDTTSDGTNMLTRPADGGWFLLANGSKDKVLQQVRSGCNPGCLLLIGLATAVVTLAGVLYLTGVVVMTSAT